MTNSILPEVEEDDFDEEDVVEEEIYPNNTWMLNEEPVTVISGKSANVTVITDVLTCATPAVNVTEFAEPYQMPLSPLKLHNPELAKELKPVAVFEVPHVNSTFATHFPLGAVTTSVEFL